MLRAVADRRWEDDELGEGVADASQFADDASELIAVCSARSPNRPATSGSDEPILRTGKTRC
jgi:hypothetical protein